MADRRKSDAARDRCRKQFQTHGRKKTPEYGIWCRMISRCHNDRNDRYVEHGTGNDSAQADIPEGFLKQCAGLLGLAAAVPVVKADPKAGFYRKMAEGVFSVPEVLELERLRSRRAEWRTRLVPCDPPLCNANGEPYDPPVMVEQGYVVEVFEDGSERVITDDDLSSFHFAKG